MKRVKIGTKFRYSHADGKPEWTVVKSRGMGTWDCEILEDVDWTGTSKTFSTEEIQASLNRDDYWRKSANESDAFFDNLMPGTIVHYNGGFQCFVRCEVTEDHQLLPIALVGEWQTHDLPKRHSDGTICLGYHVEQIVNKKTFRPHASNTWEYNINRPKSARPLSFDRWKNPSEMVAIKWDVPEMTAQEKATADLWIKVNNLRAIINSQEENPETIINNLKKSLA
jgi:hypothetical protein